MKYLSPYSNLGDSLSSINFNFTCLDIRLCNLQTGATQKWNNTSIDDVGLNSFLETTQLSSNWETMKTQVRNASAYWDRRINTIIYPDPFPEGQASIDQIKEWLNATFPPENYRVDEKFIIYFFEWYKDPALHRPPSNSRTRFGGLTEDNNVHVKKVGWASFEKVGTVWVHTEQLHFPQYCLPEDCNSCWGIKYNPDHPICIPTPTYYGLSCAGLFDDSVEPEITNPCEWLSAVEISWDFPIDKFGLEADLQFQKLSSTNLVPYQLTPTHNPHLDLASDGVYYKFIHDSSMPTIGESTVERLSAFHIQYTYQYVASSNNFINTTTFSSISSSDFSENATIDFPFNFSNSELIKYVKISGGNILLTPESSACPWSIQIDSTWYRWVTNNLEVSATPYWHISIEPGSALGFDYNPSPYEPDSPDIWKDASETFGDSLSAYFGTFVDMMGKINNIEIVA
jgi:hypothetical protein